MDLRKARIIFMGTPDFSVPAFAALIENGFNIVCVVTQEDKQKGRGRKMTPPPVKLEAVKRSVAVLQPRSLKTPGFENELRKFDPQLFITAAYGKIIPENILNIPEYGCINVHASLLPKYRGPAPIQWSIINGEDRTGITTLYSDAGIDTGDMLLQEEISLDREMNFGALHDKLAVLGARVLIRTLELLSGGRVKRRKQDDSKASYAPLITRETGHIKWDAEACAIWDLIRGLDPYPGAYAIYKGERMKIFHASCEAALSEAPYGTIIKTGRDHFSVACRNGSLRVNRIQMENRKILEVSDYLNGNDISEGTILE